ncbi:MAG: amidohydrolase family protein, partial [Clostridia bacterium]|nr:amidohydrolase family protein [Clostridia bacterium]
NAMTPFHHRNAGPIGAAIDENIDVQVICDGLHLHKSIITLLYRTFGADRMILISDSMRATGLPDGEYEFGGQMIDVKGGVARTKDGALAGSTSNLMDCVKKAIELGIPKLDAIKMATETPARLLGIKKGKIEVGYDADFVVVDNKMNIKSISI